MAFYSNPKIVTDGLTLLLDAGSENSNPGSDIIHDLSGNDNDGTMYTGKCLDFDGSSAYIDTNVTPRSLIGSSHPFSVSAWVNFTDLSNEYICGGHHTPERWYFRVQSNYVRWGYGDTATSNTNAPITTDTWYYLSWTYDNTNLKTYVDGDLKDTTAIGGQTITDAEDLYIGVLNSEGSPANYTNGKISDVKIFNTALTATQILELYNTPNKVLPTGITPSQLVGYWPLSEGDGTIAHDGSGNQNHGTLSGTTIPTWVNGETDIPQLGGKGYNKPMVFDGSNDYVITNNNVGISGNQSRTLTSWAKINDTNMNRWTFIAGFGEGATGKATWFGVDVPSGVINWEFSWWGLDYNAGTDVDTNWHHFAWTYDGSNYKGYIDGSLKVSGTAAINTTDAKLYIGKHITAGYYWDGEITEVGLWNTDLTSTQIAELATTDSNGLPLPPDATTIQSSNLVGYWRNDGDTTWEDRSGNGNNGTVNGTPDTIYLTEGKYKNRDSQGFNISDTSGWMGFDSGDYVNCGSESNLDITEDITVCLWVKTSSEATYQDLIRKSVGYPGYGFLLITSLGKLEYYIMNNTTTHDRGSIDITDDTWHYLSLTLQNDDATIYVDTVLDDTLSTSGLGSTAGTDLIVGTVHNNFNGKIALPKIYNRALTQAEITQNFNAQRNRFGI